MTVQELYQNIGADYDQAVRVLRMDKLIDKHIRKIRTSGVVERLLDAEEGMDPTSLFEASHAVKGVCANLGLTEIAGLASEIAEEYRPGNPRKMSDDEVKEKLDKIAALYKKTTDGIKAYEEQ